MTLCWCENYSCPETTARQRSQKCRGEMVMLKIHESSPLFLIFFWPLCICRSLSLGEGTMGCVGGRAAQEAAPSTPRQAEPAPTWSHRGQKLSKGEKKSFLKLQLPQKIKQRKGGKTWSWYIPFFWGEHPATCCPVTKLFQRPHKDHKAQEILLACAPCSSLATQLLSTPIPAEGSFVYRPQELVGFFHF